MTPPRLLTEVAYALAVVPFVLIGLAVVSYGASLGALPDEAERRVFYANAARLLCGLAVASAAAAVAVGGAALRRGGDGMLWVAVGSGAAVVGLAAAGALVLAARGS